MYREIGVETFKRMSQEENALVLDVRTPGEVSEFALDYDVQVDFFDRDELLQTLQALDRSKAYLVYCHSGQRSANTCCLMADMGFERLYSLKGGIGAWT